MSQRTSEEILNELFSSINVLKKEDSPSSSAEEKVVEKSEEAQEDDEEKKKKKKKSKKRKKEKKEKKKKHKHKREKRKEKKKKKHHKDESSHSEGEEKNTKSDKQTEIDSKIEDVKETSVDDKVIEGDKPCENSGNEANGDSDDGMLPTSEDEAPNQSKDSKSPSQNTSQDLKCDEKKTKSRKRSRERRSRSRKRSRSRGRKRSKSTSKDRTEKKDKENRCKERKSRSGERRASSHDRSRSRRHRRSRSPHSSKSRKRRSRSRDEFYIDKAKLLEIARKNALNMLKQGHVGADLNRVTAITAGGKTVDELTDFCKHLSQKEARGQLSPKSNGSSDNEAEKAFHHPFQLKERPNNIVMNIRNSTALPVKSHLEKTTENATTLRLQFPVSSGQLHRKTESEWVPVTPKPEPKAIMPPPKPEPEKFPLSKDPINSYTTISLPPKPPPVTQPKPQNYSLGDVISQRLAAIRKQHESTAYPFQEMAMMNNLQMWNTDNQAGLFTGSTGARVLTQAELASGQQAWARKDQLMCAQPVTSGMGMSLLQKMGWKPGEGLGKNNEGSLEPLKLPLKMDKKGLVCAEELPNGKRRAVMNPKANFNNVVAKSVKSLEGKHPVSLLVEYCTRRHFPSPTFTVCSESGPAHKKNFIFKVTVNGMDFMPTTPSPNKKLAKSEAATVCLRQLGLLPFVVPNPPGN